MDQPRLLHGPYVPLYGMGLCILFLIAMLEKLNLIADPVLNRIVLFAAMAVCMTVIEYIAGIAALKIAHVRLWDYSGEWGNIDGLICPKFSLIWALLGAVYYFFVHPHILDALAWLSRNLAFSFFIGLFFGVFIIDLAHSADLTVKLRKFAREHDVVIRYENLKSQLRSLQKSTSFFRPFHTAQPLHEHLSKLSAKASDFVFSRREK